MMVFIYVIVVHSSIEQQINWKVIDDNILLKNNQPVLIKGISINCMKNSLQYYLDKKPCLINSENNDLDLNELSKIYSMIKQDDPTTTTVVVPAIHLKINSNYYMDIVIKDYENLLNLIIQHVTKQNIIIILENDVVIKEQQQEQEFWNKIFKNFGNNPYVFYKLNNNFISTKTKIKGMMIKNDDEQDGSLKLLFINKTTKIKEIFKILNHLSWIIMDEEEEEEEVKFSRNLQTTTTSDLTPLIAGAVGGGIFGVLVTYCCYKRQKKKHEKLQQELSKWTENEIRALHEKYLTTHDFDELCAAVPHRTRESVAFRTKSIQEKTKSGFLTAFARHVSFIPSERFKFLNPRRVTQTLHQLPQNYVNSGYQKSRPNPSALSKQHSYDQQQIFISPQNQQQLQQNNNNKPMPTFNTEEERIAYQKQLEYQQRQLQKQAYKQQQLLDQQYYRQQQLIQKQQQEEFYRQQQILKQQRFMEKQQQQSKPKTYSSMMKNYTNNTTQFSSKQQQQPTLQMQQQQQQQQQMRSPPTRNPLYESFRSTVSY